MAPADRDPAPAPEPDERAAPAELSGTELAGLWSRKRSVRGPRREAPPEDAGTPADPPA